MSSRSILQWFVLCITLGSAPFGLSCNRVPPPTRAQPNAFLNRLSEPVPRDRYADDVGRFLAGLPANPGSQLAGFHNGDAWLRHRSELDQMWNQLEEKSLAPMRTFQEQALGRLPNFVLFYPFSGPDALMVTTFFPHSPVYVMVGLEPAGTLPSSKQIGRENLHEYLIKVRGTVASELGRSFFITRQMDRQFRGQVTDGLFEPILELLVRSHHTILGFRYIRLDESGQIVERAADYHAPGKIGNKGVEIDFQTGQDGSLHKLIYLSVNLSDTMLGENPQFLRFASRLKPAGTFLKATSYMLHKPEFSVIRNTILANSSTVLQDDSGIPYRWYTPAQWRVQLYGDYVRPYGSFRWFEQQDLRTAYRSGGPQPLNFRIGYGYGRVPSNLLLAMKAK